MRHFYRCDARDPAHYHLVIDSTAIPLDACAEPDRGRGRDARGSRLRRRGRSRIGGGVIAAAPITSANAASRTASASGSSGSGSPNTIGPAAIVSAFAAVLVRAITGTAGPICSERADTSSPTSDSDEDHERERVHDARRAELARLRRSAP